MARSAAAAIVLLGLGLRLFGLGRKSVWFDEAITYFDAQAPWDQLIDMVRHDVHPPLGYVVYHLWPLLDAGDGWLRLPAASLGALAVPVVIGWAWRLGIAFEALLGGLFLALAPLQVDLAQEARMYGLLLLLVATTLWLLDRVLVQPNWTNALGYGLAGAALLYTHYYGGLFLAAQGAAVVGLLVRSECMRGARWAMASLVGAGLAFVPWLPILVGQVGGIGGDYWIEAPKLQTLWLTFRDLVARTPPGGPFQLVLRVAYIAVAGLVSLGASCAWRNARQWPALATLAVPVVLALGISILLAPIYVTRYLSPMGIPLAFLLARGIAAIGPRWLRALAVVVALVPMVLSLWPLYFDPGYGRLDLRQAASVVQSERQPDDIVLHLGPFTSAPFDYYRVAQPSLDVGSDERRELCQALEGRPAGWLVTTYALSDDQARSAAESGIDRPTYAADLIDRPPLRFAGLTVFHLRSCS